MVEFRESTFFRRQTMRTITVCLAGILLWMAPMSAQIGDIVRPGTRDAQKAENQPSVPPQYQPHAKPPDPAELRREADELTKLAASIPGDVDRVSRGLLATDLNQRLKRIEKLSKRLRREISQ
jgi:hypothetical protein